MRKSQFESRYNHIMDGHYQIREEIIKARKKGDYDFAEANFELLSLGNYSFGQLIVLCADHLGMDSAGVSEATDATMGEFD